jgi:SAM-dependent methyltransferase
MTEDLRKKQSIDATAWDIFARHQPYYHILCTPSMINPDDRSVARFWESGEEDLAQVRAFGDLKKTDGVAVDFGCGIGRLTRALRSLSSRQIGLDISQEMIDRASKENAQFPGMEFRQIRNESWPVDDASCDLVISRLVFQHMSSRGLMERSIHEIGRVLKKDGRAVFQIVTTTFKGEIATYLKEILSPNDTDYADLEELEHLRAKLAVAEKGTQAEFEKKDTIERMMRMEFRKLKSFPLRRIGPVLKHSGLELLKLEREKSGSTWISAVKR